MLTRLPSWGERKTLLGYGLPEAVIPIQGWPKTKRLRTPTATDIPETSPLIKANTPNPLNSRSAKDLAEMAKKRGVRGWHSMRKDQLIKALARVVNGKSKVRVAAPARAQQPSRAPQPARTVVSKTSVRSAPPSAAVQPPRSVQQSVQQPVAATRRSSTGSSNGSSTAAPRTRLSKPQPRVTEKSRVVEKPRDPRVVKQIQEAREKQSRWKNLACQAPNGKPNAEAKDRLVVLVRDSYWLHANWELNRTGIERAEAAMGQDWHSARPVLRVFEVSGGGATITSEQLVRTIDIHGGVSNWYIDVVEPPKSYRLDIGYLAASGKYYVLSRSNVVHTPPPGSSDALDGNWADVAENFEKIYALSGGYSPEGPNLELQQLFEERLRRPMGSPMSTRFGGGADALLGRKREFSFELDAELIVYGVTEPDAHVTLQGDPVRLRPDGTFTVRFSLPNCRQVIPAVASSANGLEQRTIVLAVERNTKAMEPLSRDAND